MDRRRVLMLAGAGGIDTSLAAARFVIHAARDLPDLLHRLATQPPDIVLVQAGAEGPEMVRRIREVGEEPVRVVVAVEQGRGAPELGALDADDLLFLPASAPEVVLRLGGPARVTPDPIREMIRTLPGVVYRCEHDAAWTMRIIGDEIEHITGYPAESFVDNRVRSYASILHPEDRPRVEQEVADGLASVGAFGCEYRLIRADGAVVWVLERGRAVELAGGHEVLDGLLFEITDRKRAQSELRASMAEQAAGHAVAEERVRIAGALHDSVGHALSVIALQAGAARAHLTDPAGPAATAVHAIGVVANDTLEEMDELLTALHDVTDTAGHRGLAELSTLVARVRAAGVVVSLAVADLGEPLPAEVDATCYRVAQEGLTNALKHAPDSVIGVEVTVQGDAVVVEVVNGATPGSAAPGRGSGRGLAGLGQRVQGLGGELAAWPRPEGGFVVRASMPRQPATGPTRAPGPVT